MKLNKVLALALSGVMAVSMLAGCSGNPGNGGQEGEQPPVADTTIASVLNEEQADTNHEVKIDFTYSSSLEAALQKTLGVTGAIAGADVDDYLANVLGVDDINMDKFCGYSNSGVNEVGEQTAVFVYRYNDGKTDTGIAKDVYKNHLDSALANLTTEWTNANVKWSFSYTGDVAMSKVEKDNQTYTYIAFVMTCNTTKALAD